MTKGPMMHDPMLQETLEVIAETLGAERDRITEPEAFLDVLAEGGGAPDSSAVRRKRWCWSAAPSRLR
jgi:hypothetical protein